MTYFVFRILFTIWFSVSMTSLLISTSRMLYDKTFTIKKFIFSIINIITWPTALFSEAGRIKLRNIIKE